MLGQPPLSRGICVFPCECVVSDTLPDFQKSSTSQRKGCQKCLGEQMRAVEACVKEGFVSSITTRSKKKCQQLSNHLAKQDTCPIPIPIKPVLSFPPEVLPTLKTQLLCSQNTHPGLLSLPMCSHGNKDVLLQWSVLCYELIYLSGSLLSWTVLRAKTMCLLHSLHPSMCLAHGSAQ